MSSIGLLCVTGKQSPTSHVYICLLPYLVITQTYYRDEASQTDAVTHDHCPHTIWNTEAIGNRRSLEGWRFQGQFFFSAIFSFSPLQSVIRFTMFCSGLVKPKPNYNTSIEVCIIHVLYVIRKMI